MGKFREPSAPGLKSKDYHPTPLRAYRSSPLATVIEPLSIPQLSPSTKMTIMCGRFAQIETREQYLESMRPDVEFVGSLDGEPIGRYNVASGTRVLVLNQ